jgi:hypothetical protein
MWIFKSITNTGKQITWNTTENKAHKNLILFQSRIFS